MTKKFIFILITFAAFSTTLFAQKVYTPEKGSDERATILNALRIPVEKELKQDIQFVVDNFNVSGNWAFISGEPQTKAGERPDYSKTDYNEQVEADMFDNNFFALMKKSGKKWKVVKHYIGCTDVCYAGWWKEFKAPKAIFPYTE
jgi:hypothetical protein